MDDEDLGERSAGFRALFGDLDEPFGHVMRAFAQRLDFFVGVPAGPLHFALARGSVSRRWAYGRRTIPIGTTNPIRWRCSGG